MIAGTGEGYGGSELDLRRASGEAGEARSSKALRAVCEALGRSHARAWRSRRRKSASDLRWPTAMTAPQVWRNPRSSSQIFRGNASRSYVRAKSTNQRAAVCARSDGTPMSLTPALTNQRVRPVAERSSGFPRQFASLRGCSLENDNLPAVSVFLLIRSDWRNAASRHVLLISRCSATLLWFHSCVSELCLHPIASTHAG